MIRVRWPDGKDEEFSSIQFWLKENEAQRARAIPVSEGVLFVGENSCTLRHKGQVDLYPLFALRRVVFVKESHENRTV